MSKGLAGAAGMRHEDGRRRAAVGSVLALVLAGALAPGLAMGQSFGDQTANELANGPALAPTAEMLDFSPISDGTLAVEVPDVADPTATVTLPGGATSDGAAPEDAATVLADSIVLQDDSCLLYTSPSPRDLFSFRMPSSA